MANFDVVTIGAATLDIVMHSDKFQVMHNKDIPGGVALCQIYGSKTEVEEVTLTSGGGATNTAASFAKKELKTACISEIGVDAAGLVVKQELRDYGVNIHYLVEEAKETTAVSTVLVPSDGQRSIMVYRGASAMITQKDFPWDIETRWIHVSSLGGNMSLVKKIFEWAKKNGVRVSWNPGAKELEDSKTARELSSLVEILFVNREEAEILHFNGSSSSHILVITEGDKGGELLYEGKTIRFEPRTPKKVVDTTGVGDAFASGMISGVLYGKSYEQAVTWGLRNAEGVLRFSGAKNGLLDLAAVNK
jgi:ribokinase